MSTIALESASTVLKPSLNFSAFLILATSQLWAPMFARVFDKSIRYTVDKTSREILFLPLFFWLVAYAVRYSPVMLALHAVCLLGLCLAPAGVARPS